MKIVLCYVVVTHGSMTDDFAARFVSTYKEYPPGVEHDTLAICNGGPMKTSTAAIFSGIKAMVFARENDAGWDISGYIDAAKGPCSGYDMMLCCGESIYFHRPGWLKRFIETWQLLGPGMYGSLSSNLVRSHLNTTGFCCTPMMLRQYPKKVQDRATRYEFEHGEAALWRRVEKSGRPVRLVTWDGVWPPREWRSPEHGKSRIEELLNRGMLHGCQWCNAANSL